MFRIDPASPPDLPQIMTMIRALAVFERLEDLCVATDADLAQALFGDKPVAEVVLAREDDAVVGFALFYYNFSTFLGRRGLHLEDLFVRDDYRRRGYGRALLIHVARLAAERGCGRFEWTVLDWNAPAIAFYQGLGAHVLPDWRVTRVTGDALRTLAGAPAFRH
jgi:GNAT superfamily N-acetyltransferase